MSQYRIGNGGRLYDFTTGELVGWIDSNGQEQLFAGVETSSDGVVGKRRRGVSAEVGQSRGYIGERADAETGLVYLHARWYDAETGRFITPDWWDPVDAASAAQGAAAAACALADCCGG